jgi:hypothetical protein
MHQSYPIPAVGKGLCIFFPYYKASINLSMYCDLYIKPKHTASYSHALVAMTSKSFVLTDWDFNDAMFNTKCLTCFLFHFWKRIKIWSWIFPTYSSYSHALVAMTSKSFVLTDWDLNDAMFNTKCLTCFLLYFWKRIKIWSWISPTYTILFLVQISGNENTWFIVFVIFAGIQDTLWSCSLLVTHSVNSCSFKFGRV